MRLPQIAQELGAPLKTLERWIKKLKTEGKIQFKGSAKTGGHFKHLGLKRSKV